MSELGKNAGRAAGNAAAGIVRLARSAAQNTKRLTRIAQLNVSIADEKKNVRHLYTEIGSLYYEAHRDDPEGFFVQLFQQLDASMEALGTMETELQALKDEKRPADADRAEAEAEPDIEVEIEETPEDEPAPADTESEEPEAEPGAIVIEVTDGAPEEE